MFEDETFHQDRWREPFSERLPLFHQLDLRVDKTWTIRDVTGISAEL